MDAWDTLAKYEVLDDCGHRRMKVKILEAHSLIGAGWFPSFFVRFKGTDGEWITTKAAKGVNPQWNEEFELNVDDGVLDFEIWEAPPMNESNWLGKILTSTEITERLVKSTLYADIKVELQDVASPFPEKDTPHTQQFTLDPNIPHNNDPTTSEAPPPTISFEFTPINFGHLPPFIIRKYLDSSQLLLLKGDELLKGMGPKFDDVDLSGVIQGISVMTDDDIHHKAQLHVRVADVEFFYYYFNYFQRAYYFEVHLRIADKRSLLHNEGALDRHQIQALVAFHVQYIAAVWTLLLGLTTFSLSTLIEKKEDAPHELKEIHAAMVKAGFTRQDVEKRTDGEDLTAEHWGLLPHLYQHMFLDHEDTSDGRVLEQQFVRWFFEPTDSECMRFGSTLQGRSSSLITNLQERSKRVLGRLLDDVHFL